MKILEEFKQFAIKGNVVDMSVGIIIGTAFTGIVNSLVKDVIMPPFAFIVGGLDFSKNVLVLRQATETASAITLNYGIFINTLINFLILSFAIFFAIKQMNKLRRHHEAVQEVAPKLSKEAELLTEIRDSLKNKAL
jgi:large conductance mechanosensitive channel